MFSFSCLVLENWMKFLIGVFLLKKEKVTSCHFCRDLVASWFMVQCLFTYSPFPFLILHCKPMKCIQSQSHLFGQQSVLQLHILFQKPHWQNMCHRDQDLSRSERGIALLSRKAAKLYKKLHVHTCTLHQFTVLQKNTFLGGELLVTMKCLYWPVPTSKL